MVLKEIIILTTIIILLIILFNINKIKLNNKALTARNKLSLAVTIIFLIILGPIVITLILTLVSVIITIVLLFLFISILIALIYFLFSRKKSFRSS